MDLVDQIPVLIFHVLEADIPQNAGIIDENINAAKILNSGLDDLLACFNAVVVGHRFAAGGFDFLHNQICGLHFRPILLALPVLLVVKRKQATNVLKNIP